MKRVFAFLAAAMIAAAATACSSGGSESSSGSAAPSSAPVSSAVSSAMPSSSKAALNVDWDKCIAETKSGITGESFSYVKDVNIEVNEEKKQITFTAALDDSIDPQKALDYADTMVRQFNMNAADQDASIKSASKNFYGGVYEEYSAMVGVAPYSQINNADKWFVYDSIAKGGLNKLNLSKAYK